MSFYRTKADSTGFVLQISDYVKNGKSKAHIELELVKNEQGELITFHRSFDKANKEKFSVDDKKVTSKVYVETIRAFNIQVDNLCMFLPQDRVQDFTKLNAQEILHNTQISVCSAEINEAFVQLKEKREAQKSTAALNSNLQIQLQDNESRNEKLHVLIENSLAKDRLTTEMDIVKKKKAWMLYDEVKMKYDEADADVRELRRRIIEKNAALKPLEKRQADIADTKNNLKTAITQADTKIAQTGDELYRITDASLSLESKVGEMQQALKNVISTVRSREKEIKENELLVIAEKQEYEKAHAAISNEGDFEQVKRQFETKEAKEKASIDRMLHKRAELSAIIDERLIPSINHSKRKIEVMGDTQRQRFEVLRTQFDDAYRAYIWLKDNRGHFRGTIFNPIITEITVKDQRYAKYIEHTIANRDLVMFLCTDKNDMQQLTHKLRVEMKLQVNIGYAEDTDKLQYEPTIPIDDFADNLGIYSYLIDVINGPAPVLNYLCSLYNIHNTPIGDDRANRNASMLPDGIRVFFSTNHRFGIIVSSYSKKRSVSSFEIYSKNLLNTGVDQSLIDREHEK
jgi:chromosome segregation ATPase